MPAQYIGTPSGRYAMRCGIGSRTVDLLLHDDHPMISPRGERKFISPKFLGYFTLSGVTRNSTGTALGSCTVRLFDNNNIPLAETVSDGSGNFSFTIGNNAGGFWLEAYLTGSPDVAGTTVRNLAATAVG